MRIAIFGASGFVGSTLAERLLPQQFEEVRIFLHNAGSAWRLARREMDFHFVDILSRAEVRKALAGCTHVINCTRGPNDVMLKGLRHLLDESQIAGIQRFIHLSSVAVYGDPPPPESTHEDAPAHPAPETYGWIKLQQDRLIERAHQRGLDCVILCPPNISGTHSPFVQGVVNDIRQGTLALLEEGSSVINLVDVDNLCHAIELSLTCPPTDGRRIFVTDAEPITWKNFTDALSTVTGRDSPLTSFPKAEFQARYAVKSASSKVSPFRSLKHLISSDVRAALRQDPLLGKVDIFLRSLVAKLPQQLEDRIIYAVEGPLKVSKIGDPDPYASRYNAQQLRGVYHTCERAKTLLGYEPHYTFAESMQRFCAWYTYIHGVGTESWRLAQELQR